MPGQPTTTAPEREGEQLPPELLPLAAQLDRLADELRELRGDVARLGDRFDESTDEVKTAIAWVVTAVKQLRAGGLKALIVGQKG